MNKLKFVNIIFHTLSLFIANSVRWLHLSLPNHPKAQILNLTKRYKKGIPYLGNHHRWGTCPLFYFIFFSSGVASSYLALIALQSGKHRWYFVHPIFCRVVWHHPRRFLCTVKLSNFLVNGMLHCYTIPNFVHMISIDFSPHCSTNYISN